MFNCENCRLKNICKQKTEADNLQTEIQSLKNEYRNFHGKINITCDYFESLPTARNISHANIYQNAGKTNNDIIFGSSGSNKK